MKLNNSEVNALASRISREINAVKKESYKVLFDKKKKELINKINADIDYVIASIKTNQINFKIEVESFPKEMPGKYFALDKHLYESDIKLFIDPLVLVDEQQIKEDLIIGQIEPNTTLDSLIQTIKNKYV